ncbi:MAG: hypothetical protein Kow0013_19740 [Pararhodobacter sp.]
MGAARIMRLAERRKAAGPTRAQLAEAAGVSRETINTIENRVFVPSTALALRLAQVQGCSVHDLVALEETP